MKEQNRKQVMDIFCAKLQERFKKYCEIHHQVMDFENFVIYMIDQELINSATIKQYTILEVFHELYDSCEIQKTQAVNILAARFNLTPRSIWNLLRKHQNISKNESKAK